MNNDESLRELVKAYDNIEKFFSITYVCIEGGASDILAAASIGTTAGYFLGGAVGAGISGAMGALLNDFGVMAANEECLYIYVLKKLAFKINVENVKGIIVLPYNTIIKLKIGKFLIWNNLKINFMYENKKHRLKIMVSSKTVGIKEQKQNVKKLIDFLKQLKQKNSI